MVEPGLFIRKLLIVKFTSDYSSVRGFNPKVEALRADLIISGSNLPPPEEVAAINTVLNIAQTFDKW